MTREEKEAAIRDLRNAAWLGSNEDRDRIEKAVELAVKALEAEPCEDAISRQEVLDLMQLKMGGRELYKTVYDLPPVNPQTKTGHWIESRCDMYECSECDHVYTDLSGERYGMHYCPNCGCRMVEPQESEE